jgi:hypothetical protein
VLFYSSPNFREYLGRKEAAIEIWAVISKSDEIIRISDTRQSSIAV